MDDAWKTRLADAIKAKGMSQREVSLAAGAAAGYVHSILVEGKDPTITKLVAVCRAVGVSLPYILYGLEISRETEQLLKSIEGDPDRLEALQVILKGRDR